MNHIEIYASVIITILGVAFPILFQVITRLNDRYNSDKIVEIFNDEPVKKWFMYQLYISLILIFLWSLDLPPIGFLKVYSFLYDSASFLLIISAMLLVISFIRLVNKVLIYYDKSIVNHIIKKHENR